MSRLELTGQRFGSWLVLNAAGVTEGRQSLWSCLCDCGATVVVPGSRLTGGYSTRCSTCANRKGGRTAGLANARPDAEITYISLHRRLHRQRGRASAHVCTCGKPAAQWAYQHGDPRERTEVRPGRAGQSFLLAFTPNLDAYAPMCQSCHKRLDWQHAQINDRVRLVNGRTDR